MHSSRFTSIYNKQQINNKKDEITKKRYELRQNMLKTEHN